MSRQHQKVDDLLEQKEHMNRVWWMSTIFTNLRCAHYILVSGRTYMLFVLCKRPGEFKELSMYNSGDSLERIEHMNTFVING